MPPNDEHVKEGPVISPFPQSMSVNPEEVMREESPSRGSRERLSGPMLEALGEHPTMGSRVSCSSQEAIPGEGGIFRPRSVRIASQSNQVGSPVQSPPSPQARTSPRGSMLSGSYLGSNRFSGGLGLSSMGSQSNGVNGNASGRDSGGLSPTSPMSPMSGSGSPDAGRRSGPRAMSKSGRQVSSGTTANLDRIVQMQFNDELGTELHKQPTRASEDSVASSMWRTSSDRPYYDPVVNIAAWITQGRSQHGSDDGQERPGVEDDENDDEQEPEAAPMVVEPRGCCSKLRLFCSMVVENKTWQLSFMMMTLYALFAVDMDLIWGNEDSKLALSVLTSVIFFLFLLELIVQSIGKSGYLLRAYFWLDLIALISLLPDTWLLQSVTSSNEFVAARSSKIARLIRVASRTAKASRLNRLMKIVRVAALMPRIMAALSKKKDREVKDLVAKKLYNLFNYVDEDQDSFISQELVLTVMAKLRPAGAKEQKELTRAKSAASRGNNSVAGDHLGESDNFAASATSATVGTNVNFADFNLQEGDQVGFEDFQKILMADEKIKGRLLRASRQHLKHKNNMQQITSRHSEDMGFKVALGVLLMLLVQSIVEPVTSDKSDARGMQHLDLQAKTYIANSTATDEIPAAVAEHVASWLSGVNGERKVKYLDLQHRVFCDEFLVGMNPCSSAFINDALAEGRPIYWTARPAIHNIDTELLASAYRVDTDLNVLRLPLDIAEHSDELTDEQLNATMTSVAVVDVRQLTEFEGMMSALTTLLVILIILVGIAMLTKDMMFLSQSLLRPLRNLAEEMRTIVQLQLAGLEEVQGVQRHVVAEIDLIQRIFDNMKKAIKSWGKYVPWPVVQLLLQAGEDAKTGVREEEVSVFFSDIASFTTIVESLPPEKSLLLLSRYFNDMSRVIDDHNGIVIEYIGDAILAVYGCPVKDPEHAAAAVKATLRMLQALDKLNEWSAKQGLPQVKVRCGVHTGTVLIGNMGFHSRMKYGVVGEHAIIPGRLEEMNKTYGTDMLCSRSTLSRLHRGHFIVRPIDFVNLTPAKGHQLADVVYQVLARSKTSSKTHAMVSEAARLHTQAILEYQAQNFEKSANMFSQVNAQMREATGIETDMASTVMMKRARFYAERPPEEDWNGVWDQLNEPP